MSFDASPASVAHQPPVGIDLGTTYSVVAYLDHTGRPITVPNSWGDLLTASAVLCEKEEIIVGKEAVRSSVLTPDLYAECFKREMGGLSHRRKVRNIEIPPEVLSAFVLERVKKDSEERLGAIRQVVITVPAFFDETRRKATQDAGRLAGLDVLDIINEPTAAALAYGYHRRSDDPAPAGAAGQRVLVYDLGGGTFDVTILEIAGNTFHALASDGDVRLGGKDFDERLVNCIADRFLAAHGVDPRSDPQDAAQLWLSVQDAKHALSERAKATVVCFHAGIRMRLEATRTEFEDMTRDLLGRTETTTSLVVSQAGLEWSEIDRILLVGGSTRMPMVRQMLRRLSGKEPDHSQSPDEAVAHGAALYAGMLMEQSSASGKPAYELVNVSSHTLGVVGLNQQTRERVVAGLIPKNTSLPCRAVKLFRTAKADQRAIRVPVVEGESERPEECISLGECLVRGLPPGLPQGTMIEVEYSYAANCRLSVSARIPSIRHSAQVEISRDHARHLGDLASWRKRLLGLEGSAGNDVASKAAATLDGNERAGVLKRLDALYLSVGRVAAGTALPQPLARSQTAALKAYEEYCRAQAGCRENELARQAAASRAEIIRLDAALSQARTLLQQNQVRSDFAYLVLGRECANVGCCPPGAERAFGEIQQLRQRLGE